jgi:NTP pyrophosphatase (non-canonical NTP hydrolase)
MLDNKSTLTFAEFSKANRERCESPHGFDHLLSEWTASDWMTAVVGELGEAANLIKKLNRVRDGIPGNKETPEQLRAKLAKELGDAFVYLDLMTQSLGWTIDALAVDVFDAKSIDIGYPMRLRGE